MSSTYGEKIKISVFGESHGNGIGVVIDGLPAGVKIDMDKVLVQMSRRAPGQRQNRNPTQRKRPAKGTFRYAWRYSYRRTVMCGN